MNISKLSVSNPLSVRLNSAKPGNFRKKLEELVSKYSFVKMGYDCPYVLNGNVKETDFVVFEPCIKGFPPAFRDSNGKVIPITYPGSYKAMSINEFAAYLDKVRVKINEGCQAPHQFA